MKTYKSKIGLEFILPITILLTWIIYESIIDKKWIVTFLFLLILTLLFYVCYNIKYKIEKENLNISCGIFGNQNIDIKDIMKISETNDASSSPAASIDRLEIIYNKKDSVLVSPKDKKGFINSLLEINPIIEVKYRKK